MCGIKGMCMCLQVSAAVRKMQEEVEARQKAEAEAARMAEEQRIRVSVWCCCAIQCLRSPACSTIIQNTANLYEGTIFCSVIVGS